MRASRFAGVLGWPLNHTLSPVIHGAALRRMDLDWVYMAFPVPPESLGEAIAGLRALGAVGANITMPHKETVVPYLDGLSKDAGALGAVNTIQRVGNRLIGHNTDVEGFSTFITDDAGLDLTGARCLVLGAGGASRAVVTALTKLQAAGVVVAARRSEQARAVAGAIGKPSVVAAEWRDAVSGVAGFELIVNATPVGMSGEDLLPGASFTSSQAVVDLVYEPPATVLVKRAKEMGAAGWGGLGMLVHQAAASLRIWTGQEPPVEAMSLAALHAISRH